MAIQCCGKTQPDAMMRCHYCGQLIGTEWFVELTPYIREFLIPKNAVSSTFKLAHFQCNNPLSYIERNCITPKEEQEARHIYATRKEAAGDAWGTF